MANNSVSRIVEPDVGAVVLLAIIMLLSFFLNLFVCIMVVYCQRLRLATSAFVVNLCVADLLITMFGMSVWMWLKIEGNQAEILQYNKLVILWTTVDIFCGTLSILSLAAISLDKYIAVTRPLTYMTEVTSQRKAKVIVFLWTYSVVTSSIFWAKLHPNALLILPYVIAFLCFFIPLGVIMTSYGKMYVIARSHVQLLNSQAGRQKIKEIKAAKTISIVIGAFCICWAPFFIIIILFNHGIQLPLITVDIMKWLTYVNAFLNPLIYTLLDRRFRTLFLSKVLGCSPQNSSFRKSSMGYASTKATDTELNRLSDKNDEAPKFRETTADGVQY